MESSSAGNLNYSFLKLLLTSTCFFPHVVVSWSPEEVFWSDVESGPQFAAPLKPPKFTCEACGKEFTNRGSLQHHYSSHRGHTKCHVCGKVFGRIHTLKLHLIKKHS